MLSLVLALVLLTGCGDDEPKPAAQPAAQTKAPPSPEKQLEEARKAALAGKHEEALALGEKVLARAPKEDAVWRLIEQEAIAAGQARGLLERLDAAKAVGDRAAAHFLLRAELALAAGSPQDALASAKLAAAEDASGAAVMMARAALALAAAGTPTTEILPAEATALQAWAAAVDAEAATPLYAAARAVGGWRAALFRAQVLVDRADRAGALEEFAAAAGDADPRAKIRANLGRARLAVQAGSGVQPADAGAWADEASKVALAEGSGAVALEALELSVASMIAGGRADQALTSAQALLKALPAELEASLIGRANLAVAQAASAAGLPVDARAAAVTAREKAGDAAEVVARASWIEGWSAWELGKADDVSKASERATDQEKLALVALAALSRGDLATASASFPTTGLTPRVGALVYPEAAVADPGQAAAWHGRAVEAADLSGELGLRVGVRLRREAWLRASGDLKGASAARAELLGLAPAGETGDPLRVEIAARTLLEGGQASFPAQGTLPASVGAWSALSAGAAPPLAGDDPLAAGPASWAEGRAAAKAGNADAIFTAWGAALGRLPLHRQGSLALGTALDGSQGLPVDGDVTTLTAMGDTAPIDAWLAVHEVSHRLDRHRREARAGVDYTAPLPAEKREALLAAVARARAGLREWQAGHAPWPKEALAAYQTAESGLKEADGFGPVLPMALEPPSEAVEKLGGVGIISFRVGAGGVHGVALSKRGRSVRMLGQTQKILAMASQLRAQLEAGARGGGASPVAAGDRLRTALLDPFADVLSGVGRYLVVAPEPLDAFPLTALPEQSSGLRWLADIRNVGVLPTLGALSIPSHKIETYNPDFLGFGSISATGGTPATPPAGAAPAGEQAQAPAPTATPMSGLSTDELAASARVFSSGLKATLVGPESKKQNWTDKAKSARYIHLTGLAASPDGGFILADGPLTLAEIRATPLGAQLVVIGAEATMDQQRLRAQALLDAGAKAVLLSAWPIPDQARARFFGAYYEAIARDRTPARAVSEAREVFLTDTLAGEGMGEPSVWGSFLLVGAP